jgi:hypothetical protein
VQILGGTRATSLQSLQLHLTGAAWSWLNTLPNESIGSWGELESEFTRNFPSTYKWPASIEEVKACVQRKDETLRSYIQQWSIIRNSVENVSDEWAVDAFSAGLRRSDLVEELGRVMHGKWPARWEPQEEGVMNIAARFFPQLRNQGMSILERRDKRLKVMLTGLIALQQGRRLIDTCWLVFGQ